MPRLKKGERPANAKIFQPGQTGNPNGSSKAARLTALLRRKLLQAVDTDPEKRTEGELVMQALIDAAKQGGSKHIEIILERMEGKVPQGVIGPEEARKQLAEMLGVDLEELE